MQQRALDGVYAHLLLHPGEARGSQAEASAAVLCHPGLRPVMGWEHVAFVAGPQRLQNLAARLVIPAQAALCVSFAQSIQRFKSTLTILSLFGETIPFQNLSKIAAFGKRKYQSRTAARPIAARYCALP